MIITFNVQKKRNVEITFSQGDILSFNATPMFQTQNK